MKKYQHVIVTGGASGLGLGFAVRLLARGCQVSILDLALSDAIRQQLSAACQKQGAWQYHSVDVTDEAICIASTKAAVESFGPPDLVIHCAGIILNRTVKEMKGADFKRIIDVNLNGSFHMASAVLPYMKAGSRLALIASMAGITSNYAYAAYGASKFGVVGLATTLRLEYEPLGIQISCICPPEVKTPMVTQERTPGNADEISLALKDYAGSLELDFAADDILKQLDAGRYLIIPGLHAQIVATAVRHFPGTYFRVMNLMVKHEMRKSKKKRQAR